MATFCSPLAKTENRKEPTAMSTRIALCEASGPLKTLIDNLSGEEGSRHLRALKKLNRGENPFVTTPVEFSICKTIKIGGMSKGNLLNLLGKSEMSVNDWARKVIEGPSFTTQPELEEIALVRCTVRGLGFSVKPTTDELWERIEEVGALCPAEVGPWVRLAFSDQPVDDYFWVATKPVTDSQGRLGAFCVGRNSGVGQNSVDGTRWLGGGPIGPGGHWGLDHSFVFRHRK